MTDIFPATRRQSGKVLFFFFFNVSHKLADLQGWKRCFSMIPEESNNIKASLCFWCSLLLVHGFQLVKETRIKSTNAALLKQCHYHFGLK